MEIAIRQAERSDAEVLLALIDALADYEQLERPDAEARKRFVEQGLGEWEHFFRALLVEADGHPVGYALYFFTYSTFLARPTLYLEDTFVLPAQRHHGYGTALVRHLPRLAFDAGCGHMEWQVLAWNRLAIDFYEQLGAKQMDEWLPYRLTRTDLERICRGN